MMHLGCVCVCVRARACVRTMMVPPDGSSHYTALTKYKSQHASVRSEALYSTITRTYVAKMFSQSLCEYSENL